MSVKVKDMWPRERLAYYQGVADAMRALEEYDEVVGLGKESAPVPASAFVASESAARADGTGNVHAASATTEKTRRLLDGLAADGYEVVRLPDVVEVNLVRDGMVVYSANGATYDVAVEKVVARKRIIESGTNERDRKPGTRRGGKTK